MKTESRNFIEGLKAAILIIGTLLAAFGFYLDHSEQSGWVVNVFAPRYVRAITAYERMLDSGSEIRSSEAGFAEIALVCSEKISGPGDLTIASIRVKRGSAIKFKGTSIAEDFILEVTLLDGRSVAGNIQDLRPQIRERFFEDVLFCWSLLFFWLGVVLILFEKFALDRLWPGDS